MGIEHSQNYLHSKQLVATLLSKSNICNDDIIIEIGPGKGIITIELAKKSKQVIAIEFDAKLAKTLSERYKESKKVQIIEMDFLKYKISVKEPKLSEVKDMVALRVKSITDYHKVSMDDDVLNYAIITAKAMNYYGNNPDLTIDLVDRASAMAKLARRKAVKRVDVDKVFKAN